MHRRVLSAISLLFDREGAKADSHLKVGSYPRNLRTACVCVCEVECLHILALTGSPLREGGRIEDGEFCLFVDGTEKEQKKGKYYSNLTHGVMYLNLFRIMRDQFNSLHLTLCWLQRNLKRLSCSSDKVMWTSKNKEGSV